MKKNFCTETAVPKYVRKFGEKLGNEKKLKLIVANKYYYRQRSGKIQVDTNPKTCTCSTFYLKLVCKHLVAACLLVFCQKGLEVFPQKL